MSEDRKGITNREYAHGHERAEIEPNHDEGGRCVYERVSIHGELRSGTGCQYLTRGNRKNSTNMMEAIENTLQNGTIVRKEVDAHQRLTHKVSTPQLMA
jgi:hypothetical protein